MKLLYKNFLYEAVDYEQTPAFKAWFGNSKVKDDEGQPLDVYHGTTGDFDTFDIKKTYKDSYVGGGFYFTANPYDASQNYAGKGPDMQNKISQLVDEISNMDEQEEAELLGLSIEEFDSKVESGELGDIVEQYATRQLMGDNPTPNVIPVYLKMENPYYIGENFRQYFEYHVPYDEDTNIEGEPEGDGAKLIEVLTEEVYELDAIDNEELLKELMERIEPYDGFTCNMFYEAITKSGLLVDAISNEESVKIGSFFRDVILKAGFDGVIMDATVFDIRGMEYTRGTLHYIVYRPEQIKSVFNKNPTNHPSITKE